MTIIIDGYNLLKQLYAQAVITDQQRAQFIHNAAVYARQKKHVVYVVFDGGPYERTTAEKHGPITVIYSGYKDSADDVIKDFIAHKIRGKTLIVTTDRELNLFADNHDVPSIDVLDFYQFMQPAQQRSPLFSEERPARKLRPEYGSEELDALMQEAASMIHSPKDVQKETTDAQRFDKKLSRTERRLLELIKKL